MKVEQAKAEGFTHYASLYGVDGFYKEDGYTFEPETWIGNMMLDFFIWLEQTFQFNDDGFPIKIKGELI